MNNNRKIAEDACALKKVIIMKTNETENTDTYVAREDDKK
jgi:hypothetical protein